MINIATFFPSPTDATSFYRGAGPLGHLRKMNRDINCYNVNEVNWAALKFMDIMFLQRPWTQTYKQLAEVAKKFGVPIWCDFDDDLLNVPTWNPAYKVFSKPEAQDAIKACLSMADVITVSTAKLKELYSSFNQNIIVIPNAFDDEVFEFSRKENSAFKQLIMWRGSPTHRQDLNLMSAGALSLSKKYKFSWMFLGDNPWFVDFMPKDLVQVIPAQDIIDYFGFIKKMSPGIFIVPLQKNEFNKSKSNCAYLEATYAGAVVLAPDLWEWRVPGVIHYKEDATGKSNLHEKLEEMMTGKIDFMAHWEQAYKHIKDNLLLSNVNMKRQSIVEGLTKK
jgi:glycosyltransferase involved in cell wall biosynthesis